MKTIGLIGGLSWESSAEYYRLLNQLVKAQKGGLSQAKCILYSVDFAEILELQKAGDWQGIARELSAAAHSLEKAGCDFLVLCTNTMHQVADDIQQSVQIPLLHIADQTAERIVSAGIRKIALLGTAFTMEQDFYKGRLRSAHGLEVIVPSEEDRKRVSEIIYEELCVGIIREDSRGFYRSVIDKLIAEGAEGVILGCTEITLLIKQADSPVPVFDTTYIHAEAAVKHACV